MGPKTKLKTEGQKRPQPNPCGQKGNQNCGLKATSQYRVRGRKRKKFGGGKRDEGPLKKTIRAYLNKSSSKGYNLNRLTPVAKITVKGTRVVKR